MKLDSRSLKSAAGNALAHAPCDPKRLVFIHAGVMALAGLLVTVASYLIQLRIDSTGGLGGISQRSILSTIESMLQLGHLALLPFWQVGYIAVSISLYRGQQADTNTLCSGFTRFGPLLRLYLLQLLIFGGILIGSSYLSSYLYMMTPWGMKLMQMTMQAMEQSGSMELDDATLESLMSYSLPMTIIGTVIFLIVAVPLFYRFRLSQYIIMDSPDNSARRAMGLSGYAIHGSRFSMFKLDLSFWWYYLISALISVTAYADLILAAIGVELPGNPALQFFIPYLLYLVLQLGFSLWQQNRVAVTYAAAYEALIQPHQTKEEPQPKPKNLPWDDPMQQE